MCDLLYTPLDSDDGDDDVAVKPMVMTMMLAMVMTMLVMPIMVMPMMFVMPVVIYLRKR